MNKRTLSRILCLGGGIPLLCLVPYILSAWRQSPLDSTDVIFVPLAGITLAWAVTKLHKANVHYHLNKRALFLLVPGALLLAAAAAMHIHAAAIALSIAFWWLVCWTFRGWEYAWRLMPIFAIFGLITTSSTFWIGYFTGCDTETVLGLKIAFAVLMIGLEYAAIEHGFRPRARTVFTFLALFAGTFLVFELRSHTQVYRPFSPEFSANSAPGFIGREVAHSDLARNFFRTSDAHFYRYANELGPVSALQVNVGSNIHEIHPASLCMRSGGWDIISEKPSEILVKGKTIQVSEIQAEHNSRKFLVWVWYSSFDFSTGSFIAFRRFTGMKKGSDWRTYQVSVPMNDSRASARQRLLMFLAHQPEWLGGKLRR